MLTSVRSAKERMAPEKVLTVVVHDTFDRDWRRHPYIREASCEALTRTQARSVTLRFALGVLTVSAEREAASSECAADFGSKKITARQRSS